MNRGATDGYVVDETTPLVIADTLSRLDAAGPPGGCDTPRELSEATYRGRSMHAGMLATASWSKNVVRSRGHLSGRLTCGRVVDGPAAFDFVVPAADRLSLVFRVENYGAHRVHQPGTTEAVWIALRVGCGGARKTLVSRPAPRTLRPEPPEPPKLPAVAWINQHKKDDVTTQ